ncbi:hypothetical protein GCM10010112_58820 [Actinoplanes lobatus]|uniref:Uncharacterized protein n=1 Tax=Actinoplanes lobatus TaxID=113568 RepID=A0ABQ4AQ21_9ACTN|nr:hypothetical protein GCM10010112_58820 [Actinoplanes lobatus]GIE43101.1 hypothetical protein Alo02nite_59990 [Actinoplanes lobatus]
MDGGLPGQLGDPAGERGEVGGGDLGVQEEHLGQVVSVTVLVAVVAVAVAVVVMFVSHTTTVELVCGSRIQSCV